MLVFDQVVRVDFNVIKRIQITRSTVLLEEYEEEPVQRKLLRYRQEGTCPWLGSKLPWSVCFQVDVVNQINHAFKYIFKSVAWIFVVLPCAYTNHTYYDLEVFVAGTSVVKSLAAPYKVFAGYLFLVSLFRLFGHSIASSRALCSGRARLKIAIRIRQACAIA